MNCMFLSMSDHYIDNVHILLSVTRSSLTSPSEFRGHKAAALTQVSIQKH